MIVRCYEIMNRILLFFSFYNLLCSSFILNGTGGTFPVSVYQEATFAYQFVAPSDSMSYFGAGSGAGKCNIMGYWHPGNTNPSAWSPSAAVKNIDSLICTDKCTGANVALCGNNSAIYPRFDRLRRHPLVDIGASDSLLGAADYKAFPDLQMFPSVAGAAVPVYNVPELTGLSAPLTLSRGSVAAIFMGTIQLWNDYRILADNSGASDVKAALANLNKQIKIVVRTDSSGTTEIFSTACASFSPTTTAKPDYSFQTVVGFGQTPAWCGLKTDEIQIITTKNCDTTQPTTSKLISFAVVGLDHIVRQISFACDDTSANVQNAFQSVFRTKILVTRTIPDSTGQSFAYTIGYWGTGLYQQNWYEPYVISTPAGVVVTISTLQEGGYWNSHYNSSSYFVTPEMQSIWVNTAVNLNFSISNPNTPATGSSMLVNSVSSNLVAQVKAALKQVAGLWVLTVTKKTYPSSPWVELLLTFNTSSPNPKHPRALQVLVSGGMAGNVSVSTFQHALNYPFFYDGSHAQGYASSGRYTCYRHDLNYTAWSYYTGSGNLGVIAEVSTILQYLNIKISLSIMISLIIISLTE